MVDFGHDEVGRVDHFGTLEGKVLLPVVGYLRGWALVDYLTL